MVEGDGAVLNVFHVLLLVPPPLAEYVEDVEDAGDSGRRRNSKTTKPPGCPVAGEHRE